MSEFFSKTTKGNQQIQDLLSNSLDCLNSSKLDVLTRSIFDSQR